MKRILGFALGTVLCLTLATAGVMAEDSPYTVGDLAVRLAKMVTDKADYTPEGAVEILGQVGVDLDGDLNERVTEAYLVGTFNQLGTNLSTSSPDRQVSRADAAKLFQLFDSGMASTEAGQCPAGFPGNSCNSVKCSGGAADGDKCSSDAQCPGGFCRTPPGIAKKVGSPTDG